MMRLIAACVLVGGCVLGAVGSTEIPYVNAHGESQNLLCYIGDDYTPPGERIDLTCGAMDASASAVYYIWHGWIPPAACGHAASLEEFALYAAQRLQFELWINGVFVSPSFLRVSESITADPSPCERRWIARWGYEFPAERFLPGIYVFEGRWILQDVWCNDAPECILPGQVYGTRVSTRVATISILP